MFISIIWIEFINSNRHFHLLWPMETQTANKGMRKFILARNMNGSLLNPYTWDFWKKEFVSGNKDIPTASQTCYIKSPQTLCDQIPAYVHIDKYSFANFAIFIAWLQTTNFSFLWL